jgi:hypothetical protein
MDPIEQLVMDLSAKVQFLVNFADKNGLLPEHVFTFPDGDIWEAVHERPVDNEPKQLSFDWDKQ